MAATGANRRLRDPREHVWRKGAAASSHAFGDSSPEAVSAETRRSHRGLGGGQHSRQRGISGSRSSRANPRGEWHKDFQELQNLGAAHVLSSKRRDETTSWVQSNASGNGSFTPRRRAWPGTSGKTAPTAPAFTRRVTCMSRGVGTL